MHRVRALQGGVVAPEKVEPVRVTLQLVFQHRRLLMRDFLHAGEQIRQRYVLFLASGGADKGALPGALQVGNGIAQDFAGDGARKETMAAQRFPALHKGDPGAEFAGLKRGLAARRAAADNHQVVAVIGRRLLWRPRPQCQDQGRGQEAQA